MPIGENIGRAYITIVADGSDLDESIRRQFSGADPDVREAGRRHAKEYRKGFDDDRHPILKKFDQEITQLADRIGKVFGKGSRNDFANFTGRVVEGLVNIGRIFPRTIAFFEDWGRSIREAEGIGKTLLATFAPIGKALGAVGLAFAGLHLLIAPLISGISLLAGVVTALASSLSFAAVGGVAALAGALVPLAAGAGVAVLALVGLNKAQKALLKTDIRPTVNAFHDLQAAARRPLFANLSRQSKEFGSVLAGWQPLFRNIGRSISRIGDYWLGALKGPGYTGFKNAISKFLPGAVLSLGKSFGNALGGLGGLFRSMIPLTTEFLHWVQRITHEFAQWANSARGQRELSRFFTEAGNSAKGLGGFLLAVTKLLATIINQGREAGDSIFGDMTRAIDGWTSKLKANPDILGDWFRSARKFATAIGDAVVGVANLFSSLDTKLGRGEITAAFHGLGDALTIVAHALEGVDHIVGPVLNAFGKLPPHVQTLAIEAGIAAIAFRKLQGGLSLTTGRMTGFVAGVRNAETRMATLSAGARNIAGPAGLLLMASAATSTSHKFRVLGDAAAGALLGFSVGGPIGAAVGGLAGALVGLDSNIQHVKTSLLSSRQAIRLYKASLDPLTGAITAQTRQTVFAQINKEMPGFISQLHRAGVQSRDVISATLGNVDAQRRVRDILGKNSTLWNLVQGVIHDAGGQFQTAARRAREAADATSSWRQALHGLPKRVVTRLRADGFKETRADLLRIINTTKGLSNKQIRILLRAFGINQTVADFKRATKAAQQTGSQRPKPKLSLDHIQYDRQVLAALRAAFGLDKQKPKPHATLKDDASPAAHRVINLLDVLGGKHPSPTVSVNAGGALSTIDLVNERLSHIHNQTATITTYYKSLGKKQASGGLFEGIRGVGVPVTVGEAGAEAIVPLNRPLAQVDPSVRLLSAIAQGKGMASGGVVGQGRTVNIQPGAITVVSPNADARAVAAEFLNKIVAVAY